MRERVGSAGRGRYYVDDPEALGFTVQKDLYGSISSGAQLGSMTDEQKAERKELIANNKEWDAAETVRREWLAARRGNKRRRST